MTDAMCPAPSESAAPLPDPLLAEVSSCLETTRSVGDRELLAALDVILARLDAAVGTIHVYNPGTELLELRAHRGVPGPILEKVSRVPIGKGMAGLAAQRREPVQVCNLQSDSSGVARPEARQTGSLGSIAVPMLVEERLLGVLGLGKSCEHTFSAEELSLLRSLAELLGRRVRA